MHCGSYIVHFKITTEKSTRRLWFIRPMLASWLKLWKNPSCFLRTTSLICTAHYVTMQSFTFGGPLFSFLGSRMWSHAFKSFANFPFIPLQAQWTCLPPSNILTRFSCASPFTMQELGCVIPLQPPYSLPGMILYL